MLIVGKFGVNKFDAAGVGGLGAVDDGAFGGVATGVEEEVGSRVVAFADGALEMLGDAESVAA